MWACEGEAGTEGGGNADETDLPPPRPFLGLEAMTSVIHLGPAHLHSEP